MRWLASSHRWMCYSSGEVANRQHFVAERRRVTHPPVRRGEPSHWRPCAGAVGLYENPRERIGPAGNDLQASNLNLELLQRALNVNPQTRQPLPRRDQLSDHGQSGRATSTGAMPSLRAVSRAARSTSVARGSFIQREVADRSPCTVAVESKSRWLVTLETSPGPQPRWPAGPALRLRRFGSSGRAYRATSTESSRRCEARGRRWAAIPLCRSACGLHMLPPVSLPMAKPTKPAAWAARGPRSIPMRLPQQPRDSWSGRQTRYR